MTLKRLSLLCSAAIVGAFALSSSALAQTAPTISLNYGGQGECRFVTDGNGVTIGGTDGNMAASGHFDDTSNCPKGALTGAAAVNILATPATADAGQAISITWNATADVCRYGGTAGIAEWPTGADACIGAAACAAPHAVSFTPASGGSYNFSLTCKSGVNPAAAVTKSANVVVTGGGTGGNTGPDQCVAPPGMTRQMTGTISFGSGNKPSSNRNYRRWETTFGWVVQSDTYWEWPGARTNDAKYYFLGKQYAAFKFTVPSNFPNTIDANGKVTGPKGSFSFTNESDTTTGVFYLMTISKKCGDFTPAPGEVIKRPGSDNPFGKCIAEVRTGIGERLKWAIAPPNKPTGACDLVPGETYFVNITPATLDNPTVSTCPAGTSCKINITNNVDNMAGGIRQLQPNEVPTD